MSCLSLQLSADQLPCKTGHIATVLSYLALRTVPALNDTERSIMREIAPYIHFTWGLCSGRREKSHKKITAKTLLLSPTPTLWCTAHVLTEKTLPKPNFLTWIWDFFSYGAEQRSNCLILIKEKHHNKQRRLFRAEERCIWQVKHCNIKKEKKRCCTAIKDRQL